MTENEDEQEEVLLISSEMAKKAEEFKPSVDIYLKVCAVLLSTCCQALKINKQGFKELCDNIVKCYEEK